MEKSIDIVIPSYRADPKFLDPIFNLERPEDFQITFYIVIDNPNKSLYDKYEDFDDLIVINNETNLGAAKSRNVGIEKSNGQFLLFLDDDIIPDKDLLIHYTDALRTNGDVPGYIGVTNFPKPVNSFTRGVIASDILTFFPIAKYEKELSWGVTANMLLNRDYLKDYKFLDEFPKFGGGEDIDLCLRILNNIEANEENNNKFISLPKAQVFHPWWNNAKRSYIRFQRWAYGDSRLPPKFPKHRYYNFPNVVETLFTVILLSIIISVIQNKWIYIVVPLGVLLGDFLVEWVRISINKGIYSPIIAMESSIIRGMNDFGRFRGNVRRFHLTGIGERFDYFCNGKHIGNERKWAFIKFIVFLVIVIFFYWSLL